MTLSTFHIGDLGSDENWEFAAHIPHKYNKGDLVIDLSTGRVARIVSFLCGGKPPKESGRDAFIAHAQEYPCAYYGVEFFVGTFDCSPPEGVSTTISEARLMSFPGVLWSKSGYLLSETESAE